MLIDRRHLLGAALASAAACSPAAKLGHINLGVQRNGILYVARSRGALEKRLLARGVTLSWLDFPSGPPMIEAMSAGAVDLGQVGDTPLIYARATGIPVRLVAAQVFAPGGTGDLFLTPPGKPIPSAAALRGKRVGFTRGSSAEVAVHAALRQAGLTSADITPVTLAPGDGVAALGQGSIDALFAWDPYFTIAQSRLNALATPFDRGGLLSVSLLIARDAITAPPAAALRALLDELHVEAEWANGHIPEVRSTLAAAARMSEADIGKGLARLGSRPFEVEPPSPALTANMQNVGELLAANKIIAQPIDAAAAVWTGWKPA